MEFTEQGLVLRVGRFREADLWVRFLSRRHGVFTAFAFGGSRSRRRFSGCLDLFNLLSFSVKTTRGGEYMALQEATLLRGPKRLRHDWQRCGMASNCLRFVEALGAGAHTESPQQTFSILNPSRVNEQKQLEDVKPIGIHLLPKQEMLGHTLDKNTRISSQNLQTQNAINFGLIEEHIAYNQEAEKNVLDLTLHMFTVLEEAESVPMLFPVLFRARYAFSQGYAPLLTHCAHCGCAIEEHEHHRFLVREGTLFCPHCALPPGPFVEVSRETLDALRFVQDNSPLLWPQLCLTPLVRRECSRAIDGFIQYHIGLTWENGKFRRL